MQFLPRHFARQTAFLLRPRRTPPSKASFSMSSSSFSDSKSTSTAAPVKEQLALPETAHNSSTKLDMTNGDTTIKLDHLGPMVVNVDGSLSRISNWEGMADIEKKNTLRIIGKRNQARLEALRAKEAEEKGRD